jgi:hypothetical protein
MASVRKSRYRSRCQPRIRTNSSNRCGEACSEVNRKLNVAGHLDLEAGHLGGVAAASRMSGNVGPDWC